MKKALPNNKKCRFCDNELGKLFLALGPTPLSNSYLTEEQLGKKEPFYPLDLYVCENCFLVQLEEFECPENIFGNYSYFSSYSDIWLKHAEDYVNKMIGLFGINRDSYVVEIASNDGYLLQYFIEKKIPVLGIEPAANIAEIARGKGIPTEAVFFGRETAKKLTREDKYADLVIGNNVLAHVPDLNDFVAGIKMLLKPGGFITMEFPHLMKLMEYVQFDTIYHEHFSYFSFITAQRVFAAHGLCVFDLEEIPTHGGSLRIYASHEEDATRPVSRRVVELRQREIDAGYADIRHYLDFQEQVKAKKNEINDLMRRIKKEGKSIVGYGAPAKGNTLLNYCGIKNDILDYTVDRSPYKQGHYLPGTHIFIDKPDKIRETKPDYVFILPWNLKDEIMEQMKFIRQWGGKFIIPIPELRVM